MKRPFSSWYSVWMDFNDCIDMQILARSISLESISDWSIGSKRWREMQLYVLLAGLWVGVCHETIVLRAERCPIYTLTRMRPVINGHSSKELIWPGVTPKTLWFTTRINANRIHPSRHRRPESSARLASREPCLRLPEGSRMTLNVCRIDTNCTRERRALNQHGKIG